MKFTQNSFKRKFSRIPAQYIHQNRSLWLYKKRKRNSKTQTEYITQLHCHKSKRARESRARVLATAIGSFRSQRRSLSILLSALRLARPQPVFTLYVLVTAAVFFFCRSVLFFSAVYSRISPIQQRNEFFCTPKLKHFRLNYSFRLSIAQVKHTNALSLPLFIEFEDSVK